MLTRQLQEYLDIYRKDKGFNCEQFIKNKTIKLVEYFKKNGLHGCVIAVSGGVDSAVVYALCKYAQKLYPDVIHKVQPINIPIHSSSWALERSTELCKKFGDNVVVIDQSPIFDQIADLVSKQLGISRNKFADGQLKSYMRTPINYYTTQLLSQTTPSIVMGTGNQDEDGYLAYFCKAGDGVVDLQLISDCHKSEVFKLAKYLDVPESILKAKPSADLWENQEDEQELGVSYDFVELYTGYFKKMTSDETIIFLNTLDKESMEAFMLMEKKILEVHKRNKHKLNGIINL